jgi:ribonuclease P protein component
MEKGRVIHSPLFLVRVLNGQLGVRIAAVAPKKAMKTAVERNKMRRRIYIAVSTFKNMITPGVHAIVFAKPVTTTASQENIITDLKELFVKSGILR